MKIADGIHRIGIVAACAAMLAGCASVQVFPTSQARSISLAVGDLESQGIAFITPSAATGREEEKQAVAFVFTEVMKQERPKMKVIPLPESIGAINRSGLADDYRRMFQDQQNVGLFSRETLGEIAKVTGGRYIAHLRLQEYSEGAKERFGTLGLRIVETRFARVRLFLQIWDSRDGTIAWEGMEEILYSHERINEEPVTFQRALGRTAQLMVRRLP